MSALGYCLAVMRSISRNTRKAISYIKRLYTSRTAIERVNSVLDNVLGLERHTLRGLARSKFRLTLSPCVILAMAVGRKKTRQLRPDFFPRTERLIAYIRSSKHPPMAKLHLHSLSIHPPGPTPSHQSSSFHTSLTGSPMLLTIPCSLSRMSTPQ